MQVLTKNKTTKSRRITGRITVRGAVCIRVNAIRVRGPRGYCLVGTPPVYNTLLCIIQNMFYFAPSRDAVFTTFFFRSEQKS